LKSSRRFATIGAMRISTRDPEAIMAIGTLPASPLVSLAGQLIPPPHARLHSQ